MNVYEFLKQGFNTSFKSSKIDFSKIKIKRKDKSILMKLMAGIYVIGNFLRLCNIKNFLTSYFTTIGNTIYIPSHVDPNEYFPTMIHEICHVLQWQEEKLCFWLKYIFSRRKRAYYESECEQAEYIILISQGLAKPDDLLSQANKFINYGIPREIITSEITQRCLELKNQGNIQHRALILGIMFDFYLINLDLECSEDLGQLLLKAD